MTKLPGQLALPGEVNKLTIDQAKSIFKKTGVAYPYGTTLKPGGEPILTKFGPQDIQGAPIDAQKYINEMTQKQEAAKVAGNPELTLMGKVKSL